MGIKQLITEVQAIEFHLWSETKIEPDRHLRWGKIIQFKFSLSLRYASCSMSGLKKGLWHRSLALKNDMDFVEFCQIIRINTSYLSNAYADACEINRHTSRLVDN